MYRATLENSQDGLESQNYQHLFPGFCNPLGIINLEQTRSSPAKFTSIHKLLLHTLLQVMCLKLEECFTSTSAQHISGGTALNDVIVSLLNMLKTLLAFVECSLHKSMPS